MRAAAPKQNLCEVASQSGLKHGTVHSHSKAHLVAAM
jgi:hypothetical protein